jgi:hypothetical protein
MSNATDSSADVSADAKGVFTWVNVFADQVNMHEGGRRATQIVAQIPKDRYRAYRQCAGDYVEDGGGTNYYWVEVATNDGRDIRGWISAVYIKDGADDHPQIDEAKRVIPVHFYGECEVPPFFD